MFKHGFPPEWSTLKKLIWLVGSGIAGAAAGVWKTVTGTLIHITDALASPVKELSVAIEPQQELHGYDAPYPPGGSKNLIPDGTDTSNGYVAGSYLKSDGTIGTESLFYISEYFQIVGGDIYTWGGGDTGTNIASICFYDSSKTFISGIAAGKSLPKTFTAPSSAVYCRSSQYVSYSQLLQLELGSTATTPKPYSNICPITGWTGCDINVASTNLLDRSKETVGFRLQSDGTLRSDSNKSTSGFIAVSPNIKLYFKNCLGSSVGYALCEYNSSKTFIRYQTIYGSGGVSAEKTLASNTAFIRVSYYSNNTEVAVNYPSTETSYKPYSGTTTPISWQTEAGEVYGCTLTVNEDGSADLSVTMLIGKISSFRWSYYASGPYFRTTTVPNMPRGYNNVVSSLLCSAYKTVAPNNLQAKSINIATNYRIVIADADFGSDVSAFLSAMGNETICYPIVEPITYHFDNVAQISTLIGENNILADVNGEITLIYKAQSE